MGNMCDLVMDKKRANFVGIERSHSNSWNGSCDTVIGSF
jgi:hypothetical protein